MSASAFVPDWLFVAATSALQILEKCAKCRKVRRQRQKGAEFACSDICNTAKIMISITVIIVMNTTTANATTNQRHRKSTPRDIALLLTTSVQRCQPRNRLRKSTSSSGHHEATFVPCHCIAVTILFPVLTVRICAKSKACNCLFINW